MLVVILPADRDLDEQSPIIVAGLEPGQVEEVQDIADAANAHLREFWESEPGDESDSAQASWLLERFGVDGEASDNTEAISLILQHNGFQVVIDTAVVRVDL